VTDRCNFRCHYCMPQDQTFMPRSEVLDYREISDIAARFIDHGIRKIRLTGGEPLLRRDIDVLIRSLGLHLKAGRLDELTLTTNGIRLAQYAPMLADAGVRRINVSLDSLNPDNFFRITRGGKLAQVMEGIAAAKTAGIKIRINMVAMRAENIDDLIPVAQYCADEGHNLALIETMPLGSGVDAREDNYIPLDEFIAPLRAEYSIKPLTHTTSGPAKYWQVEPLGLRLGLITPLSKNFCNDCNRLRLTTDGKVYMCLGSNMFVDFRSAIREEGIGAVDRLLQKALRLKPLEHDFERQMAQQDQRLDRHMNATGG